MGGRVGIRAVRREGGKDGGVMGDDGYGFGGADKEGEGGERGLRTEQSGEERAPEGRGRGRRRAKSQGLDDEGQGSKDKDPGMEEDEEAAPEGQKQVARHRALESIKKIAPSTYEVGQSSRSGPEQEVVERIYAFRQPTLVTWVDLEDERVYTDILAYAPPTVPVQIPPSPEWSLGYLPVSPSSFVIPSPIALLVATSTTTISVDGDQCLEVGAQLELHESILQDHTQRLDALPPTLFANIDRDVWELYTRAVLDTQADMQCELQEIRGRVAALEQEMGRKEPYMLVDTDTESHPKEAPSEAEESQPLGSRVPLMSEESEASKPSGTRTVSSHSRVHRYFRQHHCHPLIYLSCFHSTPTPSRVLFHRSDHTYAMCILSDALSLGMISLNREAAAFLLHLHFVRDTNSEEDELGDEDTEEDKSSNADGEREPCMEEEEEEVTPEGQQQAILIVDTAAKQERVEKISAFRQPTLVTWVDPEDGKVYTDILTYTPTAAPVQTPPSLEWSLGSLLVSPSFLVVLSPIASPVAIQQPPYRFRSLEREQKRATDIQRENHDLRRQLAEERCERLELTDRIARIERRQEFGGE
ncbi:hypothetical protein Tco_0641101 [Tanacetum coccineum]